jgi:hypothetical protein
MLTIEEVTELEQWAMTLLPSKELKELGELIRSRLVLVRQGDEKAAQIMRSILYCKRQLGEELRFYNEHGGEAARQAANELIKETSQMHMKILKLNAEELEILGKALVQSHEKRKLEFERATTESERTRVIEQYDDDALKAIERIVKKS